MTIVPLAKQPSIPSCTQRPCAAPTIFTSVAVCHAYRPLIVFFACLHTLHTLKDNKQALLTRSPTAIHFPPPPLGLSQQIKGPKCLIDPAAFGSPSLLCSAFSHVGSARARTLYDFLPCTTSFGRFCGRRKTLFRPAHHVRWLGFASANRGSSQRLAFEVLRRANTATRLLRLRV